MWSWEPAALGNRIVAQSSVFVLGGPAVASDMMEKFIVRAESKNDILGQLESVYGISAVFRSLPSPTPPTRVSTSMTGVTYWLEQIGAVDDLWFSVCGH